MTVENLYIVGIDETHVEILHATGLCIFPDGGTYERLAQSEFPQRFAHRTGYDSVQLVPGVTPEFDAATVRGWAEASRPDSTKLAKKDQWMFCAPPLTGYEDSK